MIIRPLTITTDRVAPLRIQGHPISLFLDDPTPVGPTSHTFELTTIGGEYGWKCPIDVILNCDTNQLAINTSWQSTSSYQFTEGGYYMVHPSSGGSNYKRWIAMSYKPTQLYINEWEFNLDNSLLSSSLTSAMRTWLEDIKNDGTYDYVIVHPAAYQTYKFSGYPVAYFIFED